MRLVEQNSQVTPIMPSSPIMCLTLLRREARSIASMPSAEQRQTARKRRRLGDAHAALVEQAEQQALARQRGIDQFMGLGRRRARLGFGPGVVLGRPACGATPSGASPDGSRRDGAAPASPGELGEQAAGAPGAAVAASTLSPTASRTSVGICSERSKYAWAACFQPLALERDDALIAGHVAAGIDGEGEVAVGRADRPRRPRRAATPFGRSAPARANSTARRSRRAACAAGPSSWSATGKRPSSFSVEPSSAASVTASPTSFETGSG